MPEQQPPDQPPEQPPEGDDEAWIEADSTADTPAPMPPGVVYRTPGQEGFGEIHRQMPEQEPVWPFEDPTDLPPPPPRSALPPFLIGLILGIGLAGVSILGFGLFRRDADTTAEATTTTSATATTTSLPAGGTSPTTTTTTTQPQDTTTTTSGLIDAVGSPIGVEQLQLVNTGIGPFEFGQDAAEVLGRFVASFGQPHEDSGVFVSAGEMGTCEGDSIRLVRWGPLALVSEYTGNDGAFVSYRLDLGFGDIDAPTAGVRTLSGVGVNDTVATLEQVYAAFTINFLVDPALGDVFELRSPGDGSLLLWGPVTSADVDGIVTGIYSVDPCDA